MKNSFVIFAVFALSSASAFAGNTSEAVATQALKTLMRANPKVVDYVEAPIRLSSIVAENMLSSFNEKNVGTLSVSTNSCETRAKSKIIDCTLNFIFSARQIEDDGAYGIPDGEVMESAVIIRYSIDTQKKTVTGTVQAMRAG